MTQDVAMIPRGRTVGRGGTWEGAPGGTGRGDETRREIERGPILLILQRRVPE